jgi:Fis family transcriptional regulator, factor for inversion stimulation protein
MDATPQDSKTMEFKSRRMGDMPLSFYVTRAVDHYFSQLNGHKAASLHELFISEVEKPLIIATLRHTGQNQTQTAKILGLSRSTLRKKMDQYDIH